MLVILIKISNPANSWSCTEHLSTITNGSSVTSKKVQYFKPPAPVSEMQIQPPTEKICNCSIKKEPNPDISKDNPPKQASKATTGGMLYEVCQYYYLNHTLISSTVYL